MLPVLHDITSHLASFPEVENVILYGSRARGDNRPRSDIDLAVGCDDAGTWLDVSMYLEYDAPTLLHIDKVRLSKAPESLRREIDKDGIVIYER